MNEEELAEHLAGRAEEEAQTPVEESVEETPAEAETVSESQEPDPVQEYLAKYGGDTDQALRAAVEAQSLLGRQGQELGELRKLVEERLPAPEPEVASSYQPVTDDLVSWATEIGTSDNARDGALWALENQPAVYETIMDGWFAVDPRGASQFQTQLAMQSQHQQMMSQLNPILAPVQRQMHQDQFTTSWHQVKRENPDLDDYTTQLLKVAEENPEMLVTLQNGTPEARTRTIRNLYYLAKGSNAAPLSEAAAAANQAVQDGAAALRNQAAVATMTSSAPGLPTPQEDPQTAAWRSAFREEAGLSGD